MVKDFLNCSAVAALRAKALSNGLTTEDYSFEQSAIAWTDPSDPDRILGLKQGLSDWATIYLVGYLEGIQFKGKFYRIALVSRPPSIVMETVIKVLATVKR
jgi:hypothetical protein